MDRLKMICENLKYMYFTVNQAFNKTYNKMDRRMVFANRANTNNAAYICEN